GELPLGRFPHPSKNVHIDVRLDEGVLKALEKEPEQRYQQASEMRPGVEAVRSTAPGGRSRFSRTAIVLPILLVLGIAGVLLVYWNDGAGLPERISPGLVESSDDGDYQPKELRPLSTAKLIAVGAKDPESQWVGAELKRRVDENRIDEAEADSILMVLTDFMREHPNGYNKPLHWQ